VGVLVKGIYSLNWAKELGEGGMLIETTEPLDPGDTVLLTFKIPTGRHVIVRAEVRNKPDDHSTGFEFVDLDFSTKRDIRNFVVSSSDDGPGGSAA
jgi:hypothetical protein